MMFILRTIFWLVVVSAVLPPRQSGEHWDIATKASEIAGAAESYCESAGCMNTVLASVANVRIPTEFVTRAQGMLTHAPASTVSAPSMAVPTPMPRPAAL